MADDVQAENQGSSKKKTIIMIAAMLTIEAVVIIGAFFLIGFLVWGIRSWRIHHPTTKRGGAPQQSAAPTEGLY